MRFEENREDVAVAFERAASLLVRHLHEPGDLSLTSATALAILRTEGPVRLTALAGAVSVSQPAMTQLVQRLEGEGLATRVSDPEDGRGTLVGITDAGRARLADLRRARRSRLIELLRTLSAEDGAALAQAMHVALPMLERLIDTATQRRVSCETVLSRSVRAARNDLPFDAGLPKHDDRRLDGAPALSPALLTSEGVTGR